jgi:uncharacterized protein (DUF305 family)
MKHKSVVGVFAAGAAIIVLAGCGNAEQAASGGSGPAATSAAAAAVDKNDADIAFVRGMIPHHSQAVDMAKLAADRASNAQVQAIASRVEQAQGPEIEQMRGFLSAWGETESEAGAMGGMGHGSMEDGSMGMMADEQMKQLEDAKGAEFDRMFLQMMVEHHTGAVRMAEGELADGQNRDAKNLARKIAGDQKAEIAEMQALLPTV